ncbi:Tetratricopeptide repeat protein 39B [Halotydeus destructor]|nr:Tetratricopeptide repeat protein 39B [Halotydeus destructor]
MTARSRRRSSCVEYIPSFEVLKGVLKLGVYGKINEARQMLIADRHDCLYNSLGHCILQILSIGGLEQRVLTDSLDTLKACLASASSSRKKGLGRHFFRQNYDDYSDEECHSELVHCELSMLLALVSVLENQSFKGFLNGALYVRQGNASLRECLHIAEQRTLWTSQRSKEHFESGTFLTAGCLSLIISALPGTFVSLLQYAGFHGDREEGLAMITASVKRQDGLRYPFAAIFLAVHQSFTCYLYGIGPNDETVIQDIAQVFGRKYPESSYSFLINGYLEQSKGNLKMALNWYEKSIRSKGLLHKIDTLPVLMAFWCNVFLDNRVECIRLMQQFIDSNWAPATGAFTMALLMHDEMDSCGHDDQAKAEKLDNVRNVLRGVRSKKKNFGGQRAFHEKLVLDRSAIYGEFPEKMVLPIYDLAYVFNYFELFVRSQEAIDIILTKVNGKLKFLDESGPHYDDHVSYLTFIKAVTLKRAKEYSAADILFQKVLELESRVKFNKHMAPQACYEMGTIHKALKNYAVAKKHFKMAVKYKNYETESMIAYRCQLQLDSLKHL